MASEQDANAPDDDERPLKRAAVGEEDGRGFLHGCPAEVEKALEKGPQAVSELLDTWLWG